MGRARAAQRETSGELDAIRELIAKAIPSEKWLPILQRLAQSDNPKAIELLLKYRFGLPVAPASSDTLRMRPQAVQLVQLMLPMIEGSTHGADELASASGAADEISSERGR